MIALIYIWLLMIDFYALSYYFKQFKLKDFPQNYMIFCWQDVVLSVNFLFSQFSTFAKKCLEIWICAYKNGVYSVPECPYTVKC